MIDRRAFLRRLGFGTVAAAAAATGVLDVERLLWTPGERTIFLPSVVPITFDDMDWLAVECLRVFNEKMTIANAFNKQYDGNYRLGDVVRVRLPRQLATVSA